MTRSDQDDGEPMTETHKHTGRRARIEKAYGGRATQGIAELDFAELAKRYSYLVHRWARRYSGTSGGIVDWEDLVSVGLMGLMQAKMRYAPESEKPFETYAEFRIKGAILDELRRVDPMTQPMRRKARKMARVIEELAQELGREPSESELATHLNVPLAKVQRIRRETQSIQFNELDAVDTRGLRTDLALSGWSRTELKVALAEAIDKLDERSQLIMNLYYFEGLTMRELGEVVSLTEARVSQLHKAAIGFIRTQLREVGASADG